jgi:hypothetical protein
VKEIEEGWRGDLEKFEVMRAKYLIYGRIIVQCPPYRPAFVR